MHRDRRGEERKGGSSCMRYYNCVSHSGVDLLDDEGASILHRAIECDSQEDNLELVKYLVEK